MSAINYSKWDHIEVSDDEDDTHPNIDTGSLFRWRHQARMERMEQSEKEKSELEQGKKSHQQKMAEMKTKIQEAESQGLTDEINKLKIEVAELKKQEAEWKEKEEDLKKKERLTPWNIDTICKEGKSKTIINKDPPKRKELSEDERYERQKYFTTNHKEDIKKFGMFKRYEDSQQFLQEKPHLACEETANYLVLWCIELEVEEKSKLMAHVAHQTIVMQFILELAKQLDTDPRACISAFFKRMKVAEKVYMDAFNEELESFKERVRDRAKARIEEAMQEYEEGEKKKRLGPGGLDPVEVFESLPPLMTLHWNELDELIPMKGHKLWLERTNLNIMQADSVNLLSKGLTDSNNQSHQSQELQILQQCFESKDIGMLQKAILEIPKEEAEYHIKRCVDSGLWVPNKDDQETNDNADDEEVYDEVEEKNDKPAELVKE